MLRELHINNLAVIADARVELAAGLNCFTGATGAGKSLVIGAIEVLLGMRSPAELLRPGADDFGGEQAALEFALARLDDKLVDLVDRRRGRVKVRYAEFDWRLEFPQRRRA